MSKLNSKVIAAVRNCSGAGLRKTRAIDATVSNKTYYYATVEIEGVTRAVRITRETYDYINDVLARTKCAFFTKCGKRNVQYMHTISI